ncbi:GAF domain-containing protein [Limibacter armeniacum]|uniref:GAF domain-containing protein n=1 Tax=Limibacter armeniacum TaxID=466084 RepID=UPI002FE5CF2A
MKDTLLTKDLTLLNRISIRHKIYFIILMAALLSVSIVGWVGFRYSSESIENASFEKLTAIRTAKKQAMGRYFDQIRKQVMVMAASPFVQSAAHDMLEAHRQMDHYFTKSYVDKQRSVLLRYYKEEMVQRYKRKSMADSILNYLKVAPMQTVLMQSMFIVDNPNETFQKELMEQVRRRSDDPGLYSATHQQYHSTIRNYLYQFGFRDILLADTEGNILYSVKKASDFGMNLLESPFNNTAIAEAYLKARAETVGHKVVVLDFNRYEGGFGEPVMFFAVQVNYEQQQMGVLLFELPFEAINEIMSSSHSWQEDGLGKTGETYLVGRNLTLRSHPRLFEENADEYLHYLDELSEGNGLVRQIQLYNTPILCQKVNTEPVRKAFTGKAAEMVTQNFMGKAVLSAYTLMDIMGLEWAIITEIETEEVYEVINDLQFTILLTAAIVFLLILILGWFYTAIFTKPLIKVRESAVGLAEGRLVKPLDVETKDEIGRTLESMNLLIARNKETAVFAQEIEAGRFDSEFTVFGSEDLLGGSLNKIRHKLKEVAEEDRIQTWKHKGMELFTELLHSNGPEGLEKILDKILFELTMYLNVHQSAIMLIEEGADDEKVLLMKACYAYDRKKFLDKEIPLDQGLAGRCCLEAETIYIDDVPPDYLEIKIGLGNATPKGVLIVPIKFNDQVLGVLEMISLNQIKPFEIAFAEQVAESLGAAVSVIITSEHTNQLLEESQMLTNELQAREEELRQNAEELEATQEEMGRRQRELEEELIILKEQNQKTLENDNH